MSHSSTITDFSPFCTPGGIVGFLASQATGPPCEPAKREQTRLEPRVGRFRILVVEDDPSVRRIGVRALQYAGHQVEAAADGEAGWEALCRGQFDLLITDNQMPRLDGLGLVPALRSFVRGLTGRKSLRIRVLPSDPCDALDSARRTVLYRVAQEALINVVRHAKAPQATLAVKVTPAGVTLEVRDNGTAFDVERVLGLTTRKHLGLLGMRERVEMVGGKLAVDSVPGRGTTVRASIPLPKHCRRTTP